MKPRIVVIDDEPAVCDLVGKVLTRAGYEVDVAQNGEAGLAIFENADIACLIVDKQLPSMTGLEVMSAVRHRFSRTAIVLMTAHPEPLSLDAERPEVVLVKPFKNLAVIEDAVREAMDAAERSTPLTQLRDRVAAVVAEIAPIRRKRE
ncbi:MAG: response regulator [Archangium sp.]